MGSAEFHTAWLVRAYSEQSKIPNFDKLNWAARRFEVQRARNADLLRLQRGRNPKAYRQAKKNYRNTEQYIHLTRAERIQAAEQVADCVGAWGFSRLFAECIDKIQLRSCTHTDHSGRASV
jgi:hypothetical protein